MPENIEMTPVRSPDSDHSDPSPIVPDAKLRPDPPSSMSDSDQDFHDIEQTPLGSTVPLQSARETHRRVNWRSSLISIWKWGLVLFSPIISIAYLVFCYAVHYRIVPANVSGLGTGTPVLSKCLSLKALDNYDADFTGN